MAGAADKRHPRIRLPASKRSSVTSSARFIRNTAKVDHPRQPLKPDVSLLLLTVIAIAGVLLVLIDYLPISIKHARPAAAAIGTIIVALCFLPLTNTAIGELRNPPSVSQARFDGGPGGGPGFGGPGGGQGFGGPGFGGQGFGPGQFIAQAFLREADTDKNGTVSLDEFRSLAGRWFKSWNTGRKGSFGTWGRFQGASVGLRAIARLGRKHAAHGWTARIWAGGFPCPAQFSSPAMPTATAS